MADDDDLFVDPDTHEPMDRATERQLEAIAEAIRRGAARRHDGGELPDRVEGAYVSHGGAWIYPDVEGLASFLVEERIELDPPLDA